MIHLDRPALYFPGLFWFTPLKQQSDSSVVNVLIHIIIKRPRRRQLQSVTGVLELKEVSNLTDDVQRLWRHLYNEEEKKKNAVSLKANMKSEDVYRCRDTSLVKPNCKLGPKQERSLV